MFRADHIGSLLRPPELIAARESFERGKNGREQLTALEDQCIRDVVHLQEDVGLRSITDGEYRRTNYFSDFVTRLNGITFELAGGAGTQGAPADDYSARMPQVRVRDKVRWTGPITVSDFQYLRSVTRQHPKITIPAPTQIHFFAGRDGIDRTVYPELDEFWNDVVAAYCREIQALAGAGCTFVQIDETCLPKLCDPAVRARLAARGDDPATLIDTYVRVMGRIVQDKPAMIEIGMHHCRGNFMGRWEADGGYDAIADRIFNEIGVSTLFLEYDSPRAGDFKPLRFVPRDKRIVLGLISTKERALESADHVKKRIDEASSYVPIENLALSPQCGFSGVFKGHPLTHDDQRQKLELVVEIARDVWGSA